MDRRDLQLSLVQDLLAAPGSDAGWTAFLVRLCDALHGCAANFMLYSAASGHCNVSVFARTDPSAIDEYHRHWWREDAWRNAAGPEHLRPGSVMIGDAAIARDRFTRTAFYNEFGRRYDIAQCLAGIVETSPNSITNLSVNRSDSSPRFDSSDADLLRGLIPYIQRAVQVHRRLAGAELMALHANAVLDRLPHGVIFVGAEGTVLGTNRVADDILRDRDGLTCDRGELRAATAPLTNRLRAALLAAVRAREGEAIEAGGGFLLSRSPLRRPLSVVVAPLPAGRGEIAPHSAVAVVFISDPDRAPAPDVDAIRSMFGLTPAEAQLVRCLAGGLTLEQAAVRLGLRRDTVRSRLKIVFQKTDTHRQADLLRLVFTASTPALRT